MTYYQQLGDVTVQKLGSIMVEVGLKSTVILSTLCNLAATIVVNARLYINKC